MLTESASESRSFQPIQRVTYAWRPLPKQFRRGAMSMVPSNTRITPFLCFDGNADEAVNFYLSVFKNSRRLDKMDSAVDTSVPKGKVITISFDLDGQAFVALNGGPNFKFNEAISFMIRCENQEEIDYYWSKLTAG